MALINCSECGKSVSDKAVSCPNCGNPITGTVNVKIEMNDEYDFDDEGIRVSRREYNEIKDYLDITKKETDEFIESNTSTAIALLSFSIILFVVLMLIGIDDMGFFRWLILLSAGASLLISIIIFAGESMKQK